MTIVHRIVGDFIRMKGKDQMKRYLETNDQPKSMYYTAIVMKSTPRCFSQDKRNINQTWRRFDHCND